jgi:hypothetical protein
MEYVEQVVRYGQPGRKWWLRCTYIKATIELERIAVDDFAAEFTGETQGQVAFAGSCRTDDCE